MTSDFKAHRHQSIPGQGAPGSKAAVPANPDGKGTSGGSKRYSPKDTANIKQAKLQQYLSNVYRREGILFILNFIISASTQKATNNSYF